MLLPMVVGVVYGVALANVCRDRPTRCERFTKLMDKFMPNWRARRDQLNDAPLAHEDWTIDTGDDRARSPRD